MSDSFLQQLVITRCRELGAPADVSPAAEYFGVSPGLIRQWVHGSKTPSLAAVEKVFVFPEQKPAEAGWENKEVFIAMPFYRDTNPRTMFSILAIFDRAKFGFRYRWGDAFIAHTRNQLAADFKASGLPWCWWVDDDIVAPMGHAGWFNEATGMNLPPAFAGLHTPTKLRSRGVSLIGGVYFGRKRTGRALYAEAMQDDAENGRARQGPRDEFKATDWVATGCLMHTREVLLDIEKNFPHLAPQHASENWHYFSNASDYLAKAFPELQAILREVDVSLKEGSAERAGALIGKAMAAMADAERENLRHSRLNQGEDQTFCRRAKAAGHQPHVDLAVYCGHADGSTIWGPHNVVS